MCLASGVERYGVSGSTGKPEGSRLKFIRCLEAAVLMFVATAAWAGPSFEATSADGTLKALVGRWVQGQGKKFVWEADGDAAIKDATALNADARLSSATTFDQALGRLNVALERARTGNSSKPAALRACVFDDAIVLRSRDQPDCDQALGAAAGQARD